jgi:hypothetical protein
MVTYNCSPGVITRDEARQSLFDLLAAHADIDLDIAEATAIVAATSWEQEEMRDYAEAVAAIRGGYQRLVALHRALAAPVASREPVSPPVTAPGQATKAA